MRMGSRRGTASGTRARSAGGLGSGPSRSLEAGAVPGPGARVAQPVMSARPASASASPVCCAPSFHRPSHAMSNFVFPPAEIPSAAVRGTDARYAVRRIFCVGRNYADHAREMGADPTREPPFYFTTPATALTASGATVPYPSATSNYHYEMELVLALGAPVFKVTPEAAVAAIWGYAAGLDMTRRDLQAAAKAAGKPWDTAKGFDQSAILGDIARVSEIGRLDKGAITLAVNGVEKQRGDLADMIWSAAEIVFNLSLLFHVPPGTQIYTGTPAGVGAVVPGDVITGHIEGLGDISLTVGQPE